MQTQSINRPRNYRKNPHKAAFLMAFHAGTNGLPSDVDTEDLLDSVPETSADLRTEAQANLMDRLIEQLAALDPATGSKAARYTDSMTWHGAWTPGRTGNASTWITRMIEKVRELKAAAPAAPVAPAAEVADGRYAVEVGGVLKFYKVKNGRQAGFVFLDVQASDEWHSIRNLGTIRQVLALIAQDAESAMILYGQEIGECGHCGRTLTDETSRAAGIGPICAGKI